METSTLPPPPPATQAPRPRRKVARRTSAQADLETARRQVRQAQEAEARALVRVAEEERLVRVERGAKQVLVRLAQVDQTTREEILASLLHGAAPEDARDMQEWVASLTPAR